MRILLLLLLTGCGTVPTNTPYFYDVDENQSDPIVIKTVVALPTLKAVQRVCDGQDSCIKRNIATLIYQEGNDCFLKHERKHEQYGPKHSNKILTCVEQL